MNLTDEEQKALLQWGDKCAIVLSAVCRVLRKRQLSAEEWRDLDDAERFVEKYRAHMEPYNTQLVKARQRDQAKAVLEEAIS